MTSDFSQSMLPDSVSGIIFALEGIDRTCVLLNGPTGCKYYHSAISDQQRTRQWAFDPLSYPAIWYFGQPRVPSTYLDSHDYVYGSQDKIDQAVEFLTAHADMELLAIVNTPGAALIGDDLEGIAARVAGDVPTVTIQTPGFSSNICEGFEYALQAVFDQLVSVVPESVSAETPISSAPENAPSSTGPTINVLGLSLHHRNHEGDANELERLFGLAGVHVNCFVGQRCSLQSLKNVPKAQLNVVVHPEYGLETALYLKRRFGTPFICVAPPIGFAATEALMSSVCDALGANSDLFIEEAERARARAYVYLSRLNSLTGLPKGVRYSVEGTCSELLSYTKFLTEYLGMAPRSLADIAPACSCKRNDLEEYLAFVGFAGVLDVGLDVAHGELVFASGETIARLKTTDERFTGIEIALPTIGYVDVLPKTYWGLQGALMLIEHVINGLVY